ncbi:hypothetical protein D3C81_768100 [compost metagenome]
MRADRRQPRIVRAQAHVVGRLEGEADMREVFQDMADGFIGARHLDAAGDVRVLAQEALQHRLQHQVDKALAEDQLDMAALGILQVVDLGQEGVVEILLAPREQRQQAPRVGGDHAAPAPLQQRQPGVLFQLGHGAAHHRGVQLEYLGRATHRAGFDDLQQAHRPLAVQHVIHVFAPPVPDHGPSRRAVFGLLLFIQRFSPSIVMDVATKGVENRPEDHVCRQP